LGGLWALEWAWHTDETNMRCAGIFRICMPNPSIAASIVSEITDAGQIDSDSDPDEEYTYFTLLWGRKRFPLPLTYFPTNPVYPFSLPVTGITSS